MFPHQTGSNPKQAASVWMETVVTASTDEALANVAKGGIFARAHSWNTPKNPFGYLQEGGLGKLTTI